MIYQLADIPQYKAASGISVPYTNVSRSNLHSIFAVQTSYYDFIALGQTRIQIHDIRIGFKRFAFQAEVSLHHSQSDPAIDCGTDLSQRSTKITYNPTPDFQSNGVQNHFCELLVCLDDSLIPSRASSARSKREITGLTVPSLWSGEDGVSRPHPYSTEGPYMATELQQRQAIITFDVQCLRVDHRDQQVRGVLLRYPADPVKPR
jgi:hypothetical protein